MITRCAGAAAAEKEHRGPGRTSSDDGRSALREAVPGTQWHVDGMAKGRHSPFSLLVGVTLSDASTPNCGNLVVFPGSHRKTLPLLTSALRAGREALIGGEGQPKPDMGPGRQLLASAGDVVVAHHKLAHRGGANAGSAIRYQVYFRLRHVHHHEHVASGALLEDLWCEFDPSVRAMAEAR